MLTAEATVAAPTKVVLHVGCGEYNPAKLHAWFRGADWREVRLDIDPAMKPDIVASITDLSIVESGSVDAVWSSHNLEHLSSFEVPIALREFGRVLRPGGIVLVTMPDLAKAAELAIKHGLENTVYQSPAGPITPLDILFGHQASIARGNSFMAHRTGFTADTLTTALTSAGFANVQVKRTAFDLWGLGKKAAVAAKAA